MYKHNFFKCFSLFFLLSIAIVSSADDTEIFFEKGSTNKLCAKVSTSTFSTPIGVGSTNKDALSLEYIYQNVFVPSVSIADATKINAQMEWQFKKISL